MLPCFFWVFCGGGDTKRLVGAPAHQVLDRLFLDLCEGWIHGVAYEKDLEAFLGAEVLEAKSHIASAAAITFAGFSW